MSVALRHETPPHAPEAGWTRRVLGPLHVTGVFWFRFHRWGIAILPSWAVGVGIILFTTFFWIALRKIRASTLPVRTCVGCMHVDVPAAEALTEVGPYVK